MKESEFQAWVIDVATIHGWRHWHVPVPMRPIGDGKFVPDKRGKGLPDLILMRDDPPQIIFAEVKNETGTVSPEQQEFLTLARAVSLAHIEQVVAKQGQPAVVQAFLWRPANRDLIEAVLSAR